MVGLVWLGGALTAAGGLLAGVRVPSRRRRAGAPAAEPDLAVPA
jgi:cytochrome c biogenesis factor